MKTLFISQDLWDLVEKGYTKTGISTNTLKVFRKKDAKALFFIQQAVDDSIFPRIATATKSKDACDALQNGYQGNAKVLTIKLQTLRRNFESLMMKEENFVKIYLIRKLLKKSEKYDYVVAAIEESKDLSVPTVDELLGSLQCHEEKMKRYKENSIENAFHTKLQFPKGKTSGVTNESAGEGSTTRRLGGQFFHGRRGGRGGGHSSNNYQYHNGKEVEAGNEECAPDDWYIDSGCNNHMTPNLKAFISLDKSIKSKVKMGDGTICSGHGKCNVKLKSCGMDIIYNVLYVLDLNTNLLSVG
ncbi:uncharacterized protein LOC132178271 [Corylus avellana]|uniref:uncharacterized protein LOC132178271 n=1 Tax=Corylus avellana TaxID=13451 RepID=UPI00286C4F53|nr:uncharacterized protein LOC132178271 [Corylus avellana]